MSKTRKILLLFLSVIAVLALAIGLASCTSTKDETPVESITVSDSAITMYVGDTKDVTVTVSPSDATYPEWAASASPSGVVTVTQKDSTTLTVTAVAQGSSTITIIPSEDKKSDARALIQVTVTEKEEPDETPSLTVGDGKDSYAVSLDTASHNSAPVSVTAKNTDYDISYDKDGIVTAEKSADGTSITITAVAEGTVTITLTATADSSVTVTITVTVSGGTAAPTYSISASPETLNLVAGGDPRDVAVVVATDSDNTAWGFMVSDVSVITAAKAEDGSGLTVTPMAAGGATITVYADGDTSKTATISVTVTAQEVPVTGIATDPDAVELVMSEGNTVSTSVQVTVEPSSATDASWTATVDGTAATISLDGISYGTSVTGDGNATLYIRAVAAGTADITVQANDGSGAYAVVAVTVTYPYTDITITTESAVINIGNTLTLGISATPSDAADEWKYSIEQDGTVVSVSETTSGTLVIKGEAAGTAVITVTSTADPSVKDEITITVNQPVTSITLDPSGTIDVIVGETQIVAVTVDDAATDPSWTVESSSPSVASVEDNGDGTFTITGNEVSADPVTITVTATDGSSVAATLTVYVVAAETSFKITSYESTMYVGDTSTFKAEMTFSEGEPLTDGFTWSSNSDYVTVDAETGLVEAVATGTAVIVVSYTYETRTYTDSVTVEILPGFVSIEITTSETEMDVNTTSTFQATVTYTNGNEDTFEGTSDVITWKSSSAANATVDSIGLVTAVSAGTANITASVTYGDKTYTSVAVTVTISNVLVESITASPEEVELVYDPSAETPASQEVTITVNGENITDASWTAVSDNPSMATVSPAEGEGSGVITITATGNGDTTVTVSANDASGKYVTITVKVVPAEDDFYIYGYSDTMYVGDTAQLVATMHFVNGSNITSEETEGFTWTSLNDVATINEATGEVTAAIVGTAYIKVTYTYEGVEYKAYAQFAVEAALTGIKITSDKTAMDVNDTYTFTAEATYNNGTSTYTSTENITWSADPDTYITIDSGTGSATAVAAGDAVITASITYGGKTYTDSVTVAVSTVPVQDIIADPVELTLIVDGEGASVSISVAGTNITDDSWSVTVSSTPDSGSGDVVTVNAESGKGDGTIYVTPVAVGTAVITVTANDGSDKSASISVTVVPAYKSFEIEPAETAIYVGESDIQLGATMTFSDGTTLTEGFTWSSDSEYAAVDENGIVTAVKAGEATITAAYTYMGTQYTATATVTVKQYAEKITTDLSEADDNTVSLILGGDADDAYAEVEISVYPADTSDQGWTAEITSSVPADADKASVITLSAAEGTSGDSITITAAAAGTATILITSADGKATLTLMVSVTQLVTGISVTDANDDSVTSIDLILGNGNDADTYAELTVTIDPSDASNPAWTAESSAESVATVTASGDGTGTLTITAQGKGEADITIFSTDGSSKEYTIHVTVTQLVTGFDLTTEADGDGEAVEEVSLVLGNADKENKTQTVYVTAEPATASESGWTADSNNTGIATVAKGGDNDCIIITAVASGETYITISSVDNNYSVQLPVTVTQLATSLSTDVDGSLSLTLGKADGADASATVTVAMEPATGISNDAWTVTVSDAVATDSAKTDVVSVSADDGNGNGSFTVTALAAGTATITIMAADGSGVFTSFTVTVTQLVTGFTFSQQYLSIEEDRSAEVTVTATPSDAEDLGWTAYLDTVNSTYDDLVAVEYTDTTITVTAAHEYGTAYIIVESDDGNYSATITVTVTQVLAESVSVTDPDTGETVTEITLYLNGSGEGTEIASRTVAVTVSPDNADVLTWHATTNPNGIVTLVPEEDQSTNSATLLITAAAVGSTTIYVIADGASGVYAPITVTVEPVAVTSVDLSETELTLKVDDETTGSAEVTVTVNPSNATYPTWTATVDVTDGEGDVVSISPAAGASGDSFTITAKSAGTATVTVTADGVTNTISVTVEAAAVTDILVDDATSAEVDVTVDGAGAEVTVSIVPDYAGEQGWSIGTYDSNLLVVSQDGNTLKISAVSGVSATTTSVTVYSDEDSSIAATVTVNIKAAAVTGITVDGKESTEVEVQVDGASGANTATVAVAVTPSYAGNQAWSFEIISGAGLITASKTTDEDGLIITANTAVSAGSAEITVTSEEGSHTATIYVTVTAASVTGITVNSESETNVSVTVDGGDAATTVVDVAVTPSYAGEQGWTYTINEGGAYISVTPDTTEGTLTITANTNVSAGSAKITVTADEGEGAYTAVIYVTINAAAVTGITVDGQASTTVEVTVDGAGAEVTVAIVPSYAGDQDWSIGTYDSNLLTVTKEDNTLKISAVSGVSAQSTTVTVTSDEGDYEATINVTINAAAVTGITATPTEVTVQVDSGTDATVDVAVTPAYAGNQGWDFSVSGDSSYISVSKNDDEDGLVISAVTGSPAGTATIAITSDEGDFTAEIEVTITAAAVQNIYVDGAASKDIQVQVGSEAEETVNITFNPTYAGNTGWGYNITSGNSSLITVDDNHTDNTITISANDEVVGGSTVVITVYSSENSAITATINVEVLSAEITGITTSATDNAVDLTLVDNASAEVTVTVIPTYASNTDWTADITGTSDIVELSQNGNILTITALAAGTTEITITADGKDSVTTTLYVTVNPKLVTSITTSADDSTVELIRSADDTDPTADVTITVDPSTATDKTWSISIDSDPADGTSNVVSVSQSSGDGNATITITGLAAGSAIITITANDDSNEQATISVSVIQYVTGFTVSGTTSVTEYDTTELTVSATPSDATSNGWTAAVTEGDDYISITYSAEDGTISVYGKTEGTGVITITATDAGAYSTTVSITVGGIPVTEVQLSDTEVTLTVDGTEDGSAEVTVTLIPTNADSRTWSAAITSSTPTAGTGEVISISPDESNNTLTIYAQSAGSATITVTSANGITAIINVTVNAAAVTGIEVNGTEGATTVGVTVDGEGATVTVEVQPSYAGNTGWSIGSCDSGLVTVTKTDDSTLTIAAAEGLAISTTTTATVTITADGNDSITATITVNITPAAVSGIVLNDGDNTAEIDVTVDGESATVTVEVQPSYAVSTDWTFNITTGNTLITAAKNQDGDALVISAISGASAGTATITITASGDNNITAEITVNVKAAAVTGITVNGGSTATVSVQVGGTDGANTTTISVAVEPEYAGETGWSFSITSGDNLITAEKNSDEDGLIITAIDGVAAGTAYITVTADGDSTKTAQITVSVVAAAVTGITVDGQTSTSVTVTVDGTEGANTASVEVAIEPGNADNTGWSIKDDYDTALINAEKSGDDVVITAVSGAVAGTTTVTVCSDENSEITATIEVTVNAAAVTGIELNGIEDNISVDLQVDSTTNRSTTVEVAVLPEYAGNTEWTYDVNDADDLITVERNNDVLTITANSQTTGGIASITITATGNDSIQATITVNVAAAAVTGIQLNDVDGDITVEVTVDGGTEASTDVTVAVLPEYAGNTEWSYTENDDNDLITVNRDGDVLTITANTGVGAGQASITITATGNASIQATITVTVNAAAVTGISIDPEPSNNEVTLNLTDNTSAEYTVTVQPEYAGTTTWTAESDDESVVTVSYTAAASTSLTGIALVSITGSGSGMLTITAVGAGTATVTITADGNDDAKIELTVTVEPTPVTSITADPGSVSLVVGGHEQDVTITVDAAATNPAWTVTSYDNTIVTVTDNENGNITISPVAHGTTTVVITASDGSGVTCSIDVTVAEFGISATPDPLNISGLGQTGTITVSVTHEDSDDDLWNYEVTSGEGTVITVDKSGNTLIVTSVASGTATIVFTADGDSTKTAEVTVNVTNPVTAISISSDDSEIKVNETAEATITVTPSGADTEAWTITVTGDADAVELSETSGSGSGTVTITGKASGTATITVTSTATSLSDSITITVIQLATSITTSADGNAVALTLDANDATATAEVTITVGPEGVTDGTWSAVSSNPDVASVSPAAEGEGTLTITGLKAGTAVITITSTDGNASATINVTVTQLVTEITVSESSVNLTVNGTDNTATLTVSVEPSDADVQTWTATSNNDSVATVSQEDDTIIITAVATGNTTITIASTDGGQEAVVYVYVTNPITSIELAATSYNMVAGEDGYLVITVNPLDADDASWTLSSDSDAVTILTTTGSGSGSVEITGAATGTAVITATSDANSEIKASVTINVTNPVNNITISSTSYEINVGEQATVTVTVYPTNADDTSWTISSSSDAVTLSTEEGSGTGTVTVTGAEAGEATITVTSKAVESVQASLTITVSAIPVTSITASEDSLSFTYGDTGSDVSITVANDDATDKTWTATSGDSSIATVTPADGDGDGTITITPVGAGTTTITVEAQDGSGAKAEITVTVEPSLSITGEDITYPSATSTTLSLSAEGLDSYTVSWTSATTSVATISGSGSNATVTAASSPVFGSTVVTATVTSNGQTYTATKTVYVTGSFFYLAGLNESSWSTYSTADDAATAGKLLDSTSEDGVYAATVHIDKDATEWGFVIYFGGIETEVNGSWPYYDYKISVDYYDVSASDTGYVNNLESAFQITESGYYTITLNLNGGQATVSINEYSIDVTSVSLTQSAGSTTLEYGTSNNSVTYSVAVDPSDATYNETDFSAAITQPDDWASYLSLSADSSTMTVTVTCTAEPATTFTASLVVTISGVASSPAEFTVKGNSVIAVDHVSFEETSYAYDVNNGGNAWTTTVTAYGYGSDGSMASESGVTYSTTDANVSVNASTGAVTASGLGTFTITATSTSDSSKSTSVEVTFYSDTFYIVCDYTSWTGVSASSTTITSTFNGYTFTDSGNHKTFTWTTNTTLAWGWFAIYFLGEDTWDAALKSDLLDTTGLSSSDYWYDKSGDSMQYGSTIKTITIDLSGTSPVITFSKN